MLWEGKESSNTNDLHISYLKTWGAILNKQAILHVGNSLTTAALPVVTLGNAYKVQYTRRLLPHVGGWRYGSPTSTILPAYPIPSLFP